MSQNIPKIPLDSFTAEGPEGDKGSKRVVEALREFGFLYVSDVESTVPQKLVDRQFELATETFKVPEEEKKALYVEDANRLGWGDQRRGKVDLAQKKKDGDGDFKALGGTTMGEIDAMFLVREQYQISGKFGPGSHDTTTPRRHPPCISSALPEIEEFTRRCNTLCKQICSGIARGLGLDPGYFDEMHSYGKKSGDQYRYMLYHPVPPPHNTDANLRLAGHHDIGTITLLFQNGIGGLQAQGPDGTYFDVPPLPGCVTVNLGTVMEVLCGHAGLKATKHRVGMNEGGVPRYSIAHFSYPVWDTGLVPVPTKTAEIESGADVNPDAVVKGKAVVSKFFVDGIVARLYGRQAPREEDYLALAV